MKKRRLQWGFNPAGSRKDPSHMPKGEHDFVQAKLNLGLSFAAIAPMVGRSVADLERAFAVVVDDAVAPRSQPRDPGGTRSRRRDVMADRKLTTWRAPCPRPVPAQEVEREEGAQVRTKHHA